LSIRCLAELVGSSLGESNREKTQIVAIGRFNVDMGFDECLPFADQRTEFVVGEVHAVKVGEAFGTLHIFHLQFDLAVRLVLIILESIEVQFADSSLPSLGSDLSSNSLGDSGLVNLSLGKVDGSLDVVPLLLNKVIDDLLLGSLLLSQLLVFTNGHFDSGLYFKSS